MIKKWNPKNINGIINQWIENLKTEGDFYDKYKKLSHSEAEWIENAVQSSLTFQEWKRWVENNIHKNTPLDILDSNNKEELLELINYGYSND